MRRLSGVLIALLILSSSFIIPLTYTQSEPPEPPDDNVSESNLRSVLLGDTPREDIKDTSTLTYSNYELTFSYGGYYLTYAPYVIYNGNYWSLEDIINQFPSIGQNVEIERPAYSWKYSLVINDIPLALQPNIDYIGFKRVDTNLSWDDVEVFKQGMYVDGDIDDFRDYYFILIKDKVVFHYRDLLYSGFTVQLNRTDLLIGNIQSNIIGNSLYLDPSIELQDAGTENIKDTYVSWLNNAVNFGAAIEMRVNNDTAFNMLQSYITYNLSQVINAPNFDAITDATLYLNYTATAGGPAWHNITTHFVNNTIWGEMVVTWDNQPCGSVRGVYNASCNSTPTDWNNVSVLNTWYSWDVLSIVQNYNTTDDYSTIGLNGWASGQGGGGVRFFAAKEFALASSRPILNVTYSEIVPRTIGELPSVEDAVSNDTTTSATYEDVDGLSVNITTVEQADILIMASIQAEANESAVASYRLVFDGVNFQGLRRQVGTLAGNMVLVDLVENKSAGNYELKLQHNISAGLLSTINTTIYAVQLHNGNGRVPANSSFTASDTIAAAVPADISGLETEISLARTSHVWMALTWAGEYSLNNRQGNFTINIDGVNLETRFRNWPTKDEFGALSLVTRTNEKLPNGTYMVKGVWQGDATGTLTGMNFSLVVFAGEANGTVAEFEILKITNDDDTTTAVVFEDIDDLTLNFTALNNSHVMGFLTFDSQVSNINTDIFNSISINGTDQEEMKRGHASPAQSLGSAGQVVRTNDTLSAGVGNMTGRWHTDAANTATGTNIILVAIVLFTEDTGIVELTIIFHTGISSVLVDSVSEANLTVIVVTLGDTVNISSTVSTDFSFYRYEILELENHTHFAEYDQVMNQDLTVEAFTLAIGAGGVASVAGVSMLLFAILVGFAVIVLIGVIASRKR